MTEQEIDKKKTVLWAPAVRAAIFALVVGAAAGVIGAAATESYLISYSTLLGERSAPFRLSEQRPRPLPGTYEESLGRVSAQVAPSLVRFIAPGQPGANPRSFLDSDAIGSGVLITTDGFVLTDASALPYGGAENAIVGDSVYGITEVIKDKVTGAMIVKLDGTGFPVVQFGQLNKVQAGSIAFVVPKQRSIVATSIERVFSVGKVVHPSHIPNILFSLGSGIDEKSFGSPVSNSSGELIGIVVRSSDYMVSGAGALVRPLHHIFPAVESTIKDGSVLRAYLGVNVLDISNVVGLSEEKTRGRSDGALVIKDISLGIPRAVDIESPAAKAGILDGDIILSVNGEFITSSRTLSDLLLEYESGASVKLLFDRGSEEKEIEVVLGTLDI